MAREYKDSGIYNEAIPLTWNVRKFGGLCSVVTDFVASGSFADLRANVHYLDSPDYAMLVRTTDLAKSNRSEKRVYISKESYDYLSNSNLFGGEIVLPNIGSIGDVYIVPSDLYSRMSLAPNAIMFKTNECDKYFYYYFQSKVGGVQLDEISQSTAMAKFNKTDLRQLRVLCPPYSEQQKIADYLDKVCGEVDEMVALQETMIEELKAYKQSVITEAVTKGLNPNAPMRNSCIDWIGEIPEHWEVRRIGRLFKLRDEKNYKPMEEVQLLSLYTGIGVFPHGEQEERGNKAVTVEGYKVVHKDDIVVNIILAWMGAIGVSDYDGVTSPAYDVYIPDFTKVVPHYFHYVFRTKGIAAECYKYGRGIMMMRWRTYSSEFKQISVPYPSKEEQQQIASYLDTKCSEIDSLIALKQAKIEELKEYKKSVIYEYVTGKKEVV